MNVIRVHDDTGSHIEPELDPDWPPLRRLEWHAAVVAHDTGLDVQIYEMESGWYSASVGFTSMSAMPYRDVWVYLTGVAIGVDQERRATT